MSRFLHRSDSGYRVPTNADIRKLDILFVGEFDAEANPARRKGPRRAHGRSIAPAIANAVYHPTDKRVRDLPITVEKLL
jgi:xanthine dehydrogenase YagR molybdenum-binding subunit